MLQERFAASRKKELHLKARCPHSFTYDGSQNLFSGKSSLVWLEEVLNYLISSQECRHQQRSYISNMQ